MAKLILADTSFSSQPIYRALRAEGHDVWVVGGNKSDALAKSAPEYVQMDYSDVGNLVSFARSSGVEALIPGCNDVSYEACSAASRILEIPGIDLPEYTAALGHKRQFRKLGLSLGLSVPQLHGSNVPLDMPLVVKPVDAFSGKGVTVLSKPSQPLLEEAIAAARRVSRSGQWVVEEYVQGQLHSHSAFLQGGKIIKDVVVIEHCTVNPFVVDTSRVLASFPGSVLERMRAEIELLSQHLSLEDGLIHSQLIIDGDRFWWIELTRRCPGDLYSQLIELSTGMDYVASYVAPFLAHVTESRNKELAAVDNLRPLPANPVLASVKTPIMRHTLTVPQSCGFHSLRFRRPLEIERWVPLSLTGETLQPSPLSRLGILFAREPDQEALLSLYQATLERKLYSLEE